MEHLQAATTHRVDPVVNGLDGPGDHAGVVRDGGGVPRYRDLPTSVVHALREHAAHRPDDVAIVDVDGREITFTQLWDRVLQVSGGLRDRGVTRGDRVAFTLDNSATFIELFLGIIATGAIAVPLNTRLSAAELDQILADCTPKLTIRSVDELLLGEPDWDDSVGQDDLAAIYYTSGTTGLPKGATSTHEALLSIVESVRRTFDLPVGGPHRVVTVVAVPLFHVTGCNGQMLATLLNAGKVVVQATPVVGEFLDLVERYRASLLVLVPALYHAVVRAPEFAPERVKSVRWAIYGGAPVSPALVEQIAKGFETAVVANGFGMSETSSLAAVISGAESIPYADSIGYPVPAMDVGVLDADPRTGVGELVLRGQTVTRGYWGTDGLRSPDGFEGWMRTGDGGRIDAEGRIYLVDRLKDMINRGGENVFCVEVESALIAAPGVVDAAVVGVPDERLGERVGAVIVPGPGFDLRAVIESVASRVAGFKVPERVRLRSEGLPRNAAGKVLKPELRRKSAEGSWDEVPSEWSRAKADSASCTVGGHA